MKGRVGNDSLPATTTNTKEHMKTLIKAGAMLAIIAGFGLATATAATATDSACAKCCKTGCSSCAKCSDGKCASCCNSCSK